MIEFVEKFLALFVVNKIELIKNAAEYIEGNDALPYNDISLYSHQKDIFNICKQERTSPKLIFYQAPTGTGKRLLLL